MTERLQRGEVGRFQDDEKISGLSKQAVSFSEVFRTYDVTPPFSVASTLDRAAYLLPYAKGYLNVEDELYLAAALGCQLSKSLFINSIHKINPTNPFHGFSWV